MSDIDNYVDSIQRRMIRFGTDPIKEELNKALEELEAVREGISASFEQDFRYDNVTSCSNELRGACYDIRALQVRFGELEMLVANAINRIRSA
jgi:hypothetical protein